VFLQTVSNHDEQLPFTFLRHLLQCWYNVIKTQINCESVNPVVSLMNTKLYYIRSLRAAVGTPRSLCPGTQRDKEIAEVRPIAPLLDGV